MTALRCAVHRARLPSLGWSGGHAATCLRCQAATARYGVLLQGLRDLRDDEAVAPPHLVDGVMSGIDAAPPVAARASGRGAAVAIAGGTVVAIAAAAIARHRRAA